MDKIPNEWLSEVFMCQLVGLGNILKDHLSAKKFVFKLIHYGKLGQWGVEGQHRCPGKCSA